ncbi:palmitoyltransferase ZDHHC23-like isoform X2 [Watersipora subatra]
MNSVIADRLRIPWYGGAGAIQIQLDAFVPILVIPTLLVISITHYYVAWSVSLFTPLCLISYYRHWRRNPQRNRTRFFFSWGLVSTFTMGYVFFCTAVTYREIYLAEGMIVLGLFLMMLYSLYLTKQDPGSIRQDGAHDSYMRILTYPKGKLNRRAQVPFRHPSHSYPSLSRANSTLDPVSPWEEHQPTFLNTSLNEARDFQELANGSPSFDAGDGHPFFNRMSSIANASQPHFKGAEVIAKPEPSICDKCAVKLSARASHCNVCHQCFSVRDHHCIWLDQCIGLRNHRAFIVTLVLFLTAAVYALHLTLTTICTPIMVLDYFLMPVDCRFVYADLLGAIAYVSCCYTAVSISLISLLFIQQLILISQNATIQEFNQSIRDASNDNHTKRWWKTFYLAKNPYNRGLRHNWLTFLRRTRHEPYRPTQSDEDMLE